MQSLDTVKPFLRWAGGKNWLVKSLPSLIEELEFNSYHEPFLGGASIFFALAPKKAFLSDANNDLINTYVAVRDNPQGVISYLKRQRVNEDEYYRIRASNPRTAHCRAGRFIYLNRTSFNGIYRVNRSGSYNVPYGHRDGYCFDYERIEKASEALKGAKIRSLDFFESLDDVKEKDLVFLDPPYTVSHNNNGFIEYNKKLFSLDDQERLKRYIDIVNERGAFYILTNAAHEKIESIFKSDRNALIPMKRQSTLGGINAHRGETQEYIFTNIPKFLTGAFHE